KALELLQNEPPEIAQAPWAKGARERVLEAWTKTAWDRFNASEFKKAEEVAKAIAAAADYPPAKLARDSAVARVDKITSEVKGHLNGQAFEAAYQKIAKDWPSDEARPLKDEIFNQWFASAKQLRAKRQLEQAQAALLAMEKYYAEVGRRNA